MRKVIPKNASLVPGNARCVFKGIIYDTYQWQQELYDGSFATFEMLKRPDTLKVIAVNNGKIVLLEQEQPGLNKFYDLPGGRHDYENEDELEATKRELLEETGMRFNDWKLIEAWQPAPKIESFVYIFLAQNLIDTSEQKLDAGEKIKVHWRTLEELKEMIGAPETRFLPKEIFEKVNSIDELLKLDAYNTV